MEQQYISGKLIAFLGLLIILLNILTTFVELLRSDSIAICNEQSGITVVVTSGSDYPIVVSEGSLKDVLSCIGKSTPFYTRVIGAVISSDVQVRRELEERYDIMSDKTLREDIQLDFNGSLLFLKTDKRVVVIGVKKMNSPFAVQKLLSDYDSSIVYMPENTPEIDEITKKIISDKGGEFHAVKKGQKVVTQLF